MSTDGSPGSPGLRHRLRYRFDNLLARGTWAVLVWLGVVTILTVLLAAVLLTLFGVSYTSDDDASWLEDLWQTLLRVIDPGTMAGDVGWGRRLLALTVTIFGILVAGTLIGVIAAGVEDRVDRMRRGRSVVIERDHVVLLGMADHLPFVIGELVQSPTPDRPSAIVVLADVDPADVHAALRGIVDDLGDVRLVVRSGDPTRPADLELVRLDVARSVIVLGDADDPMRSVRTVLAAAAAYGGEMAVNTVVEVDDAAIATRLAGALGPHVHPVVSRDAVARIAAFALRQRGLVAVVQELIDAARASVRIGAPGVVEGVSFGALVAGLETSRPIGVVTPGGTIELAPSDGRILSSGDRLVTIGPDDQLTRSARPVVPRPTSGDVPLVDDERVHVIVAGWSHVGELMLAEWLDGANASSTLTLIAGDAGRSAAFAGRSDDPRVRVVADDAEAVATVTDPRRTVVVLLAGAGAASDGLSASRDIDTDTLLAAATIERRLEGSGERPRIVVELLDPDSVELAKLGGVDDFVISDSLTGMFVAQLAIEPLRRDVLLALYDRRPPDLVLVGGEALGLGGPTSMGELVERACRNGMLTIGWRDGATGALEIAPPMTTAVDWTASHRLVVIR